MFSIDELFIDYPHLRKYFYDGETIDPAHVDYDKVVSIAYYLLDYFASMLIHQREFEKLVIKDWWEDWVKESFKTSPILCQCLIQRKAWYLDELHQIMKKSISDDLHAKLSSIYHYDVSAATKWVQIQKSDIASDKSRLTDVPRAK